MFGLNIEAPQSMKSENTNEDFGEDVFNDQNVLENLYNLNI